MEAKPKISRYLIIVVIALFAIFAIGIYCVLASESITKHAINAAIANFVPAEKISLKLDGLEGCLLEGIKINKIELKHIKPNFEAVVNNFEFKPSYEEVITNGNINISGEIGSVDASGVIKLSEKIASVPAFIGPICLAGLPGNFRIKNFNINNIKYSPCADKSMLLVSEGIKLSETSDDDRLDVKTELKLDWKNKPMAVAAFSGILDQKKNKLNGNIRLNAAKQLVISELSVSNSKKGIEVSGYLASQTVIDIMPLSQWLGYMWQSEYPYTFSGKIGCHGAWLYSNDNGFMANLKGSMDKLEGSLMGVFPGIFELNGDWKFFDGALNLKDNGSKLLGLPASLNGKIEGIDKAVRKFDLTLDYNSVALDKLTGSLPWVLKYSNGIPDLNGIATLSVKLLGSRPMINSRLDVLELNQPNIAPAAKVSGKAFYLLPETGNGSVNANFTAETGGTLPAFFKRFSNNMFSNEYRKGTNAIYKYSVNGSLDEGLKLKGNMMFGDEEAFETNGDIIYDRLNLKAQTKENRVYTVKSANPIDLLLMR